MNIEELIAPSEESREAEIKFQSIIFHNLRMKILSTPKGTNTNDLQSMCLNAFDRRKRMMGEPLQYKEEGDILLKLGLI